MTFPPFTRGETVFVRPSYTDCLHVPVGDFLRYTREGHVVVRVPRHSQMFDNVLSYIVGGKPMLQVQALDMRAMLPIEATIHRDYAARWTAPENTSHSPEESEC